ncbi:MAG: energy-coupling factor ABC transporter ATP-binding protein [Archaeoglobaceae archaeon]|nr:energy-coupling factor ABC transporter ATP-binding protein [Archaeoglobaceae archaeon]MCX8152495.1 energy-coupling factor ABC transporter ATP-binding protein [Archaeoglobaceae archaeon]MDW8013690.1 ABC transporter ATP-binding protein [Archaeoglobaceae archaeon]
MIEALDVWFSYYDKDVLKGVNLKVKRGEVVVLMGRNGAGKTTLLLHLNGLLKPKKGEVRFDGSKIKYDKRSLFELRKKVTLVFQNPEDQILAPTVWQEVVFGPLNAGIEEDSAKEALKLVGLEGFERRLCSQLSLGEKKRLSIASAIAMRPEFILLDEPTAGLDSFGFKSVVKIVESLKGDGKGIAIATHDFDLACKVGDRFYYMEDGKIIYEGDEIDLELAEKIGVRIFYESYKARSNRSSFCKNNA